MLDTMYKFIPDEELEGEDVIGQLSETIDWGLTLSGVPDLWTASKGSGISVAVVDTGVYDHIDLQGQIIDKFDATGEGISPSNSHGTHVSGIIAAKADDEGIVGVAPESKIYSVKVLGAGGVGSFQSIMNGLKMCEDLDCQIINMSLGIPKTPPEEFHTQIKKLYHQGKYLIAAAGNNSGAVNFPAAYPEVIAVAAIDPNQQLARFSSRGDEVDVSAPGTDIYSCWDTNEYKKVSGTSQAAPFFSGICAILLSYAKANPDKLDLHSFEDLLKLLDTMCDPNTSSPYAGILANSGYGVPHFANNMPWKN